MSDVNPFGGITAAEAARNIERNVPALRAALNNRASPELGEEGGVSDDLIAFVRARLDEDEAAARNAVNLWRTKDYVFLAADDWPVNHDERVPTQDEALHIVRWDPARVLAEVEAKRRMLVLHVEAGRLAGDGYPVGGYAWCGTCGSGEPNEYPTEWPCATVRLLALPFADHPDYRPAWRPAAE